MTTLLLSPADVEKVRFAYSPLIEVSASFKLLYSSNFPPAYQAWIEETRRIFKGIDFPYMDSTILPHGYIADFLTPTPTKAITSFEDEIDRLREAPDALIRRNIEVIILKAGMTPVRRLFLEHPRESLECLIEELRFYWQQALEPHWPQLSTILENDVLFRARALARYGIDAMFTDLAERVEYHKGAIRIEKLSSACVFNNSSVYQLKGAGIQLVPSMFAICGGAWQIEPQFLPMLIYQARGLGLWRRSPDAEPGEALAMTLGTSRARLLQTLAEPTHTSDLAQRLNLTAGAVSRQLGKLSHAGLIESYRSGSKVYYRLSMRGERLLDVFVD